MSEEAIDDLTALLPPLLQSLDALAHIARHIDPLNLAELLTAVDAPDAPLRAARNSLRDWPANMAGLRTRVEAASDAALEAFDLLRAAPRGPESLRDVLRALKRAPRALEQLYPLAKGLEPVSRFFLESEARDDATVVARLGHGAPAAQYTGVMKGGGEIGARGGFSFYVPEYYSDEQAWPVVMALHGGSGDGSQFLWSWLPTARAHGAILIAPSSIGRTWALTEDDADTANLTNILARISERWRVDPARALLTGMSDGGTYCYVAGLRSGSPFTHLAPVSSSFHPLIAEMADAERLRGLPIRITHGRLDWMFPVAMARQARDALAAAGADVAYDEIADLSHCYPREAGARILRWMEDTER